MTDELTNLNWLCSITTADSEIFGRKLNKILMPSSSSQMRSTNHKKTSSSSFRLVNGYCKSIGASKQKQCQSSFYSRPPCSYSCLIAMALKASPTGCLPVHEIYRFVEQEYPFYKTAPEGWKNSIRHNLSMNQNFIKIQRPDGFQTKKGYYWAANPSRQHILDIEMERALKAMGRNLVESPSAVGKCVYPQIYSTESKEHDMDLESDQFCSKSISSPLSPETPNTLDEETKLHIGQLNQIAGIKTPERNMPFANICRANETTDDDCESLADILGGLIPTAGSKNKQRKNYHFNYEVLPQDYYIACSYNDKLAIIDTTSTDISTIDTTLQPDTEVVPSYIRPFHKSPNDDEDFKTELEEYDEELLENELDCNITASDEEEEYCIDGFDEWPIESSSESIANSIVSEYTESLNDDLEEVLLQFDDNNPAEIESIEKDIEELDMDAICDLHNEVTIAQLPTISSTEEAVQYITGSTDQLPLLTITDLSWELPTECNESSILVSDDTKDINFEAITELAIDVNNN